MIFWFAIAAFMIPLLYMVSSHNKHKHDRNRKLELIKRKLVEKEKSKKEDEVSEAD